MLDEGGNHEGRGGEGFHRPVMVDEVLAHLDTAVGGEIMDATVGGGGHSRALLERDPSCRIVAVDRDPRAIEVARSALAPYADRVRFVNARFDAAAEEVARRGPHLAGALLDLGVSTHQLDSAERGFSFRDDAPLDMRMGGPGPGEASEAGRPGETAADLLNDRDEADLGRIFREYGDERRWRRLAKAVTLLRGDRPFRTGADLSEAMAKAYRRAPTNRDKARIWQSLRVELNGEVESLEQGLPLLRDALRPGGVLSVIAYESVTDRLTKRAFRDWSEGCVCPPGLPVCACGREPLGELVERRAVTPSPAEVEANPRARSARLRSWRKAA